jgi:hypothetical protein
MRYFRWLSSELNTSNRIHSNGYFTDILLVSGRFNLSSFDGDLWIKVFILGRNLFMKY